MVWWCFAVFFFLFLSFCSSGIYDFFFFFFLIYVLPNNLKVMLFAMAIIWELTGLSTLYADSRLDRFSIWARSFENKPSAIYKQQRRRLACTSAQSDQHLCFRCLDSICILAISKVSRFLLASVAEQAGLNLTWSKIPEDTFLHDMAHLIFRDTSNLWYTVNLFNFVIVTIFAKRKIFPKINCHKNLVCTLYLMREDNKCEH